MKKSLLLFLLLPFLGTHAAHAATGSAQDGLLFTAVIVGFLACVALLLFATDFLRKNGKRLLFRIVEFFRRRIKTEQTKDQFSAELI